MQFFTPLDQRPAWVTSRVLFVRPAGDPVKAVEALRRELQSRVPDAPYTLVQPLAALVNPQMRAWQLGATMFGAFGLLAVVVAALGLYSVLAYDVSRRIRELGIRVALGAGRGGHWTHGHGQSGSGGDDRCADRLRDHDLRRPGGRAVAVPDVGHTTRWRSALPPRCCSASRCWRRSFRRGGRRAWTRSSRCGANKLLTGQHPAAPGQYQVRQRLLSGRCQASGPVVRTAWVSVWQARSGRSGTADWARRLMPDTSC